MKISKTWQVDYIGSTFSNFSTCLDRKPRINWPNSKSAEWERLDVDLFHLLRGRYGAAENKAESHPKIIYRFAMERFGPEETRESKKKHCGPSRRQQKAKEIRSEIKKLKQAFKEAAEDEKQGIDQLQREKLKKLRHMKRSENLKKSRGKFKKNSAEFLSQPYGYARQVLNPKVTGKLKDSKEEVESHLHRVHSAEEEEDFEIPEDLHEFPEPEQSFNMEPPTFREFDQYLRKTRMKSAPGPNGVPYKVYKKCPKVARLLYSYLKEMWKKASVSDSWRRAEGTFLPKENGATTVDKFRTVNFLNVEGKLYFSL